MTLWQRTDGSLLGAEARSQRDEILDYLQYHSIPAVLEVYPASDEMVGFGVLTDPDGRTAQLRDGALISGLELEDLAADIAERFDLNVVLGDVSVELFDEEIELEELAAAGEGAAGAGYGSGEGGGSGSGEGAGADSGEGAGSGEVEAEGEAGGAAGAGASGEAVPVGASTPEDEVAGEAEAGTEGEVGIAAIRAVTITAASEEYFPALARSLGEPVTTASAGGREVVLTSIGETAPGTFGWDEEALPIVQLIAGPDRSVIAISDESATARTWGTERTIVPVVEEPSKALAVALAPLDSDDDDARVIASVSPTADLDAVREALRAPAERGPALLLEALGIGAEFADFLSGTVSAEEMPGARLWQPATAARAIRTAIGDAMDDAADLKMVEMASDFNRNWPALSRTISIVKAALGSALLVAAARTSKGWRGAGALTGGVLLLDSLADVVLFEWLRGRKEH